MVYAIMLVALRLVFRAQQHRSRDRHYQPCDNVVLAKEPE
jgi:hypothetical protein